jgi:hypothetical protein
VSTLEQTTSEEGAEVTAAPERRFADARAGCRLTDGGVRVPLFGRPHLVTHPGGEVTALTPGGVPTAPGGPAEQSEQGEQGGPAHVAVAILLLHYLLLADGAPPADTWSAYRELPDGLFYAASFADRAEAPLTRAFAGAPAGLDAFRAAARAAGGDALTLGDASFRFVALPRVDVAVLVWAGDDEEPGEARVLFDANAGHYLPAEDLAGLGGQLAHRLAAEARA